MEPYMVDISEISDSVEIYEARPKSATFIFIYFLLFMLAIAGIWMFCAEIDISIKSGGMVRYEAESTEVTNLIEGIVSRCKIKDGIYVNKGDVLLVLENDEIDDTLKKCDKQKKDAEDRISAMKVYLKFLNDIDGELTLSDNSSYCTEFNNRSRLLKMSINNAKSTREINNSIKEKQTRISELRDEIEKLSLVEQSVKQKINMVSGSEKYYYSLSEKFLSEYEYTRLKYKTQIAEMPGASTDITDKINTEMNAALKNIEETSLYSINQSMISCNNDILNLQKDISSLKEQAAIVVSNESSEMSILKEKQEIEIQLSAYNKQLSDINDSISQCNLRSRKLTVYANKSGYIHMNRPISNGIFLGTGIAVCKILPKESNNIYVEIYVNNVDIGRLKEGQCVKLEVGGLPSCVSSSTFPYNRKIFFPIIGMGNSLKSAG